MVGKILMAIYDDPDYWFNATEKKTKKSKGSAGGSTPSANRARPNKLTPKKVTANAITAINKKTPQVMVKISGSSKGADKAQAHANYIGRHGKVEIQNEAGEKFNGKEDQEKLLKAWEAMGMPSKDAKGTRKETFNFVFSMPKGTNPEGLKTAVKNLVNEEFHGHKYFMAQHLDTDSPHVHVLVSATDDRGARLNPRKADLHSYRVQFAHKLAEQGIEATASHRIHRFKEDDGKLLSHIHQEKRTGQSIVKEKPSYSQRKLIEKGQKKAETLYKEYANKLPDQDVSTKLEINKLLKDRDKQRGRE